MERHWHPVLLRQHVGEQQVGGRILVRWRNAGLVEHQGEVVGGAVWPAIVNREEVAAVRSILSDPDRRTSPGPARKWLLSGIATCGRCGAVLRKGKGPRGQDSYRCSSADRGCYLSIRVEEAEKVVFDAVRLVFVFSDAAQFASTPKDRERLVSLRTDLSELDTTEKEVGEKVGAGEWSMRAAESALKGLLGRRQEIDRELSIIASRIATADMLAEPAMVGQHVDME